MEGHMGLGWALAHFIQYVELRGMAAAGLWDAGARFQPRVSFEYELWGGAAIWSGNAINWRHKFLAPKVSRSLALEVRHTASLPAQDAFKLVFIATPRGPAVPLFILHTAKEISSPTCPC